MYCGLHVKYPLFMSDFNETRNFSADFRKIQNYQIQTDVPKLIVVFAILRMRLKTCYGY